MKESRLTLIPNSVSTLDGEVTKAYEEQHSGHKRPSSSRTVGRLGSRWGVQTRPLNKQLKSAYRLGGLTRVERNRPITNGATASVHIASQRTVCLKIHPRLHRLARAGSKNLRVYIRSSYGSESLPYAEETRRTAASRIGVMTTRADLDCK